MTTHTGRQFMANTASTKFNKNRVGSSKVVKCVCTDDTRQGVSWALRKSKNADKHRSLKVIFSLQT